MLYHSLCQGFWLFTATALAASVLTICILNPLPSFAREKLLLWRRTPVGLALEIRRLAVDFGCVSSSVSGLKFLLALDMGIYRLLRCGGEG